MEKETLRTLLESLTKEEIPELLSLLNAVEREALAMRVERLITESSFPEPNPEWPAVPWPPF